MQEHKTSLSTSISTMIPDLLENIIRLMDDKDPKIRQLMLKLLSNLLALETI